MTELKVNVKDLDTFFADVREAARRIDGGDFTPQAASISFANVELMFAVLTPNRWRLLGRLREIGLSSIRGLSKALARDYRGVHADVVGLIEAGLIERDHAGVIRVP